MSGHILIVDDSPDALKLLGYTLHRAGFEIKVAQSGREAIEHVLEDPPALIILDIMMPEMDGFETCRQIRKLAQGERIPIIMLTAKSQLEDKVEGFEAGADDYVTKPVLPAELIARVKALLARAQRLPPPAAIRKAFVLVFMGVKGGSGTSTLALNTALALLQTEEKPPSVILADLHPWHGTLALQLGLSPRASLINLLELPLADLSPERVQEILVPHPSGLKLLASNHLPTRLPGPISPELVRAIFDSLETVADFLVADIPPGFDPANRSVLERAHLLILTVEPERTSIELARAVIPTLEQLGIRGNRLGLVVVSRARTSSPYTVDAISERLGLRPLAVISPAPELCSHASEISVPIVIDHPDALIAEQYRGLAQEIVLRR